MGRGFGVCGRRCHPYKKIESPAAAAAAAKKEEEEKKWPTYAVLGSYSYMPSKLNSARIHLSKYTSLGHFPLAILHIHTRWPYITVESLMCVGANELLLPSPGL
jgi:hypothetical protein